MKYIYTSPEILVVELSAELFVAASGTGSFENYGSDIFKY